MPQIGRFISHDPIGLAGGANMDGYVGGDPISYADPLGLFLTSVDAACLQDLQFSLELAGDLVRNAGAMNGNQSEANQVANTLDNGGVQRVILARNPLATLRGR